MLNKRNHHPNNELITQRGRSYYVNGKLVTGDSVSEAPRPYLHKFNRKEVLKNMGPKSQKRSLPGGRFRTDAEMKEHWRDRANYGEEGHSIIENYYNGIPIPEDKLFELRHFIAWDAAKPADWIPYWSEQAIWCPHRHDDKLTAGRLDMLFVNDKKEFFHVDWKFAIPDHEFGEKKSRVWCNCGAWKFGDVECVEHNPGCSAIGPHEYTKHLLMYRWAGYACNNSIYSEMLRRNYGFNVVESRLVFLHPDSDHFAERFVDFDKHTALVNAILGA